MRSTGGAVNRSRYRGRGVAATAAALLALAVGGPSQAEAIVLPANFQESTPITGLTNPTTVRFSPDGRVFVAEKSGLI